MALILLWEVVVMCIVFQVRLRTFSTQPFQMTSEPQVTVCTTWSAAERTHTGRAGAGSSWRLCSSCRAAGFASSISCSAPDFLHWSTVFSLKVERFAFLHQTWAHDRNGSHQRQPHLMAQCKMTGQRLLSEWPSDICGPASCALPDQVEKAGGRFSTFNLQTNLTFKWTLLWKFVCRLFALGNFISLQKILFPMNL